MSGEFADDRDDILRRLRTQPPIDGADGAIVAPSLRAPTDLPAAFIAAAKRNGAEIAFADNPRAAPAATAAFLRRRQAAAKVACEEELLALPWREAGIAATFAPPTNEDGCGVTGTAAAAADTGAMLLTDAVPERLTLSLLPPNHVAIVRAGDIVADIAAIWRRLAPPLPRGIALACGPSRTADIEQTLTLGAHGPMAVLIVLVAA